MLKNKSDALKKFKEFLQEVENQFSRKIKKNLDNRGHEYESFGINLFIQLLGIIYETTPYSPSSNGVAERKNRKLIELTNAMLIIKSGARSNLWDGVLIACHILNRVLHKKTKITSFELWKEYKPNLGYLEFGAI